MFSIPIEENDVNLSDPIQNTSGGTNADQRHPEKKQKKNSLSAVSKNTDKPKEIGKEIKTKEGQPLGDLSNTQNRFKDTSAIDRAKGNLIHRQSSDRSKQIIRKPIRETGDIQRNTKTKNSIFGKLKTNTKSSVRNLNGVLIENLRWKVRNGLNIRSSNSVTAARNNPPKMGTKVGRNNEDKSRFDEKPWDLLRACMEQREQWYVF